MTDPAARRTVLLLIDGDLVDEVRAALSAEVARAQRAATRAAAELVAETDGKDPRSGALAIARSLATAARLAEFAENLLVAWSLAGDGLPPKVAEELADQADAAVKPRRRRTKAEIAADVAAQAEADRLAAESRAYSDRDSPLDEHRTAAGDPPPAGATRDEVIAATRAELDRLNGPEDPPPAPEVIPTLEEAARSIEAQGPKPEPGDRPAGDDVAEALSIISAPEPAGA